MSDRRVFRLATTSARLLAGTVVAAAFATAVATGVNAPWPRIAGEAPAVTAQPAPTDTVAACAGPLLVLGRDPSRADAPSVAVDQRVVSGVAAGAPMPQPSRLAVPLVPGSVGPEVFTAAPVARQRSEVAAAGSAEVVADDIRGFAASACLTPLLESWIVAGATTTGAADLLLLANPGAVAATVDLTVYGAGGAQQPPSGAGIVVAPGTQRIVPLAGLVLGEQSPVVRVTSTGAPVQASLQSSITRTLVPGGVEQTGPAAPAAGVQVITGVQVTQPPGEEGASEATTILRLLSADADTTATVRVVGAEGVVSTQSDVRLAAGIPTEVELGGLAVGGYSIRIDAGGPVVAAAWEDAGSDFAWYGAGPELSASAVVAIPEGPSAAIALFNAGADATTVAVERLDGSGTAEFPVAAGATAAVPALAGAAYRVAVPPGSSVHASVTFVGDGALSGFPLWPEDAAAGAVVVHPFG